MLSTIRDHWAKLAQRWVAIALPTICSGCGRRSEDLLCPNCLPPTDSAQRCVQCALALPVIAPADVNRCGQCLHNAPQFERSVCLGDYRAALKQTLQTYKFGAQVHYAKGLARLLLRRVQTEYTPHVIDDEYTNREDSVPLLPAATVMTAIPLTAQRLRQRGFNQAHEVARALAPMLGLRYDPYLLERVLTANEAANSKQAWRNRAARLRSVKGVFRVRANANLPQRIILIDDILTTGATLNEAARVLRRQGVVRVDAWVLARAPLTPQ